jgi:hypothetical protein
VVARAEGEAVTAMTRKRIIEKRRTPSFEFFDLPAGEEMIRAVRLGLWFSGPVICFVCVVLG